MNHIPEGVSAQSLPVGLCSRGILQICVLQCKNDNGKKKHNDNAAKGWYSIF